MRDGFADRSHQRLFRFAVGNVGQAQVLTVVLKLTLFSVTHQTRRWWRSRSLIAAAFPAGGIGGELKAAASPAAT